MDKRYLLVLALATIGAIAFVTVYFSIPRAGVFTLNVENIGEMGWCYNLWYNGNDPLTDVHVLVNNEEYEVYTVLMPNHSQPVLRWISGVKRAATVDVQWNDGREVLNFS
jgi:hypothetical protein